MATLDGSQFPDAYLGGGFNSFWCSPLFGEDSHFDYYFSDGLKQPTRYMFTVNISIYIYILVYVYDIFVVGWEHGIFDIKNPLGRSTIPPQPGMSP